MKQIENPFPGLRPFQAKESHLFFGRENQVNEILHILETGHFVSVVGNSGSGKSSLIRAGILPKLHTDENWTVVTMRPGSNPVRSLAQALEKHGFKRDSEGQSVEQILIGSDRGLIQVSRGLSHSGKKLLLLVDQFEEVFRFHSADNKFDESAHLAQLLVQSVTQHELPIYVMISLRSDFLGDCEQFEGLPQVINKGLFLIPRLNSEELKTVITGPVNYAGAKISPVLVQKLTSEVGSNPDQLPVLQHALMRTFESWAAENDAQKPIDVDVYEKTGGISKALSNHAEEAFAELKSEDDRSLAESIFKVITFKGADNRGVRRPTSVASICRITGAEQGDVVRVLNVFRDESRGFVMPPYNVELNANSIIDISHESLMRVWDRLKNWADEEAESAELYGLLTNSALLYEKDKAGLYHDPDLQLALDWKKKNKPTEAWALQYNPNFEKAMRFLNASEQHRRHLQKISSRYRRLIVTAMITAIAALSVLSVWAFSERQNSVKSAKQAVAEKQKAQAQKEIAEKQKGLAENNLIKANAQEKRALAEQAEAERQKNIALLKEEETRLQKLKAERASVEANDARQAAELDRKIAESQKLISDSLRVKAERSEKNAKRLRVLSLAQNMAINSRLRTQGDSADEISVLLALQAFKFNKEYNGDAQDAGIYEALLGVMQRKKALAELHFIKQHTDAVKSVIWGSNSKTFVSSGDDGKVVFNELFKPGLARTASVSGFIFNNLAYSPDYEQIVYSGDNNQIYLANCTNLKNSSVNVENVHTNKITSILWTDAGILTTCLDNSVRLFSPLTGKLIRSVKFSSGVVSSAGSKKLVAIGCQNGIIYSIDRELISEPVELVNTTFGPINTLDFNATGDKLAFGTNDGACRVKLMNQPGAALLVFKGHAAGVQSVKFNPVSDQLATSSFDSKVIFWNAGHPESSPIVINVHDGWVHALGYSPDGKYLASCSKDKTVRIWCTDASILDAEISGITRRNFTESEWNKYIGSDIPYEKTVKGI